MLYGRQSTAIIVTVGPVLDAAGVAVTDGVVGDFLASKNGAAPAALNGSATLTHRNTGHYSLSLTATDLNTVGTLEIVINDTTNACPIKEITVLEEAAYDVLFAASAPGPASPTNITAGTITTATNVTTVNGLAANVITAASIAADAITAAKVAADVSAEIADAVLDEDMTAHQTQGSLGQAIGDPVADTNTIYKAVVTDAAGATVGVDVVAVKAETASIQSDTDNIQTRIPAALVSGRIDAHVGSIADAVLTAAKFAAGAFDAVWSVAARILTAATNITTDGSAAPSSTNYTAGRASNLDNLDAAVSTRSVAGDAMTLTAGERNSVADAFLARNVAGGSSAGRTVTQAVQTLRNKQAVVAGVYTCYETDDVTPLFESNVGTAPGDPMSSWSPTS